MKKEIDAKRIDPVIEALENAPAARKPSIRVLPRLLIALVVALCLLALVLKQAF